MAIYRRKKDTAREAERPWWWSYALEVVHSGSRVICNPPVKNTDDDYLLLLDPQSYGPFVKRLRDEGFVTGGSGDKEKPAYGFYNKYLLKDTKVKDTKPKSDCPLEEFPDLDCPSDRQKSRVFESWKKGDLNLILTLSRDYAQNFALSTTLAKELNLLEKAHRVALFEAICYNAWPYHHGVMEKVD